METEHTTFSRIIFQLSGPSLAQVIQWQQARDLGVIQHQLETKGAVMTIRYGPTHYRGLQPCRELPHPGEAVPYYGEIGDAYSFRFQPEAGGCYLRVVNGAGGKVFWHPEPFSPLELHLPHPIQIDQGPPGPRWLGLEWPWWHNWPNNQVDELRFEIDHKYCRRLLEWGWDARRPENYEYCFFPTSVGCEILVKDLASGEENHLTRDVCW